MADMNTPAPTPDGRYTLKARPRRRWLRRIGLALLVLVVGLVGTHGYLGWSAGRALREELDGYRRAGEPVTPADFAPRVVPDEQNAAVALGEAFKSIDTEGEAWQRFEEADKRAQIPLSAEERAALGRVVEENAAALDRIRRAEGRPEVEWGVVLDAPVAILAEMKFLGQQRTLARLLGAATAVAHYEGNDAEALRRVEDMLFISRAVDRQPMLLPHLVSIGVAAMACDVVVKSAPDMGVAGDGATGGGSRPPAVGPAVARPAGRAQVTALVRQLLNDAPLLASRRRMMLGERMSMVDAGIALSDGRLALTGITGTPTDHQRQGAALSGYLFRPMALNDARIMARYATTVRDALVASDLPSYNARIPHTTLEEMVEPRQLHLMASILTPSFNRVVMQDYKIIGIRRMTAVALACRLYALDHDGRLPAALADLVPAYLPDVPADPLTAGRPLGYVPDRDRPRVYSVGEDGRDDGGYEPSPTATWKERQARSDDVHYLKTQPRIAMPEDEPPPAEPLGPNPVQP
jgi:hypothetical protein